MRRVPVLAADEAGIAEAAARLAAGGLVAVPTETVYGLGADASSPAAVARIFAAKGRPADHPLIVHLADPAQLDEWALDVPEAARALADAFWPGPLTLVLSRSARVPDAVTGGRDTVGLRVPDHPAARALLRAFGGGVAAPSANRFGRVSPTTAAHVLADLGDHLDPDRDAILDGGPSRVGVESTIVDCTGPVPVVLRPGGVSADDLERVLRGPVERIATGPSRAPGMLAAHYAPDAQVLVVSADDLAVRLADELDRPGAVGVLGPSATPLPPAVVRLPAPDPYDAAAVAAVLYARLREADERGLRVLLVVPPPGDGIGAAVLDRLVRAATGSAPGSAHRP